MIKLCSACQKHQTETELCDPCVDKLEQVLAELPAQFDDLTAVATRQAAGPLGLGDNSHGRQWDGPLAAGALGDGPWVYAPGAADQLWAFEQTVTAWATHIAAAHGYTIRFRGPGQRFTTRRVFEVRRNRMRIRIEHLTLPRSPHAATAVAGARWLQAWLPAIRTDPAAAQLVDELTTLHAENHRWSIGTSEPSQFAGTCDTTSVRFELNGEVLMASADTCGADLYAHEGDDTVRCHRCGHEYQLGPRRQMILEKLNDQWCRAQLIADALTTNDEPINASTLRSWILRDAKLSMRQRAAIDRPLILQVGIDDDAQPLYRVGDVRARIAWVRGQPKRERISA